MDSKGAPPTQVYEDIVPTTELVQDQDSDTLLLDLTGFKREQVKVQLTREGILKISGQRPVAGQKKWLRFQKDFPVLENCDKTKISAKFENGILYVKQPKLIKDQELPTPNAQQPKKPAEEPQPQKKDEEQTKGEKTPTPKKPAEEPQPPKKDEEQTKGEKTPTPEKPEEEPQPPKKDEEQTKGEKIPTPPAEEPQPPKKDEEQTKGEKIPTPTQTPTPTPTEELPMQQTNADKPEKEEPNSKEAKDLAGKTPVEKTGPSSTVEDGNYESKLETAAEKLKMPRKVMNMTLIALLVLVIGLYISNMMKFNYYKADK